MKLSDFDFDLPEHLIALRPVKPRPAARLLVARRGEKPGGETDDSHVRDLAEWLRPGDMLVFNDTKVIPARLSGERRRASTDGPGVAKIEVTLIHRDGAACWTALARPAKRLAPGDRIPPQLCAVQPPDLSTRRCDSRGGISFGDRRMAEAIGE